MERAILFYRNPPYSTESWRPLAPGFSVPPKFKGNLPSNTFGPEAYQQNLTVLIARIREDVAIQDLPIVIGEVIDNGKRDSVRQAARAVGTSGPGLGFVPSAGLTTWDAGTHFDAASQLRLGRRFGKTMLGTLGESQHAKAKVVCFGDSITNRAYGDHLPKFLDVQNINSGVGGNNSSQGLRRVEKDVIAHDPDAVVILSGTNDLRVYNEKAHVPLEKYRANLGAMIDRCDRRGIDVILCTIPPIEREPFFARHEREPYGGVEGLSALVQSYCNAAKEVAEGRGVTLLDLYRRLLEQPDWVSNDGVHQSESGNRFIAEHVVEALKPLLPK